MEELSVNLKEITSNNLDKRILKTEKQNNAHKEAIKLCIEQVFNTIINKFDENLLVSAAKEGMNGYNLFYWDKNTVITHDNFKFNIQFLFRGPFVDKGYGTGTTYYKNIEVHSLLEKLRRHFSPMFVNFVWNKQKNQYILFINWK
uniref:Uncharacterized protein n=1 Tax=viral metagenome TaxID=1070528 RepID=A0A6C0F7I2_9ZZZZ|tara:strand:- start:15998 stop:16432 length:435 start_codon:yes stop_codon:yes gene_type:complete